MFKQTHKYDDKTITVICQDNGWNCIVTDWNDGTREEEYVKTEEFDYTKWFREMEY